MEKNAELFKRECERYLNAQSINALRSYGRYLQLTSPTKMKKGDLIEEIVKALCGEIQPQRNNKGAPIKNGYVEPQILKEVERFKEEYFSGDFVSREGKEDNQEGVLLQFAVNPAALTEEQRQKLHDFLNSL